MSKYKQVYKQIKKYNKIVIARHIGPDPDALGSSLGLKEAILNTFPNKKVYVVGAPANKHSYLGNLDTIKEDIYKNSMLIVLDVPDIKRVDGVDPLKFEYKVKIDHHPLVDKYCDIEIVDEDRSSASELVLEMIFETPLKINEAVAEKLFAGIVCDTNRFLFYYSTSKTFKLVGRLLEETNLDITKVYENVYTRSIADRRLQSFIINNIHITENGLGYILLTEEDLEKIETDAATITNVVNDLTYIKEMIVWIICAYDKQNKNIRTSIRSRGPIINEVASHYNGGGHIYASGARPKDFDEANKLVEELDLLCKGYDKNE